VCRTAQELSELRRPRCPNSRAISSCSLSRIRASLNSTDVLAYVPADKTFCVYLAEDGEAIRQHAARSGFPASKITEVKRMIDPTTALGT
jgi:hypothetical protein